MKSSNANGLAVAAAAIAASLIWSQTENVWVTVGAVVVVMALVSGQMFGALMSLFTILVREGARVLIAYKRYTALMYQEHERTERERLKWAARTEVEQLRSEAHLVRASAAATQQRIRTAYRIAAQQPVDLPVEPDELVDVDYIIVGAAGAANTDRSYP